MSRFEVRYEHFKREDTTNSMVINLYNDDGTAITPNSGHTWVGKIAKDDKYVGEYPLTISGTKIILPSSSLTRLPFGEYQLELWETTGGQTTIYPNAGFIPVTIHRNADDTMGEVDPTTDINKIIADLKTAGTNLKVGSTTTLAAGSQAAVSQTIANGQNTINFAIPQGAQGEQGPQGPKGDTGAVGPQGPKGDKGDTNETATNALKVANSVNDKLSAIQANGGGRNLVSDSGQEITGKAYFIKRYSLASLTELMPGKTYKVSFSAKVDDKAVNCNQKISVIIYNSSWSFQTRVYAPISTDYQRVAQTFTIPEGQTGVYNVAIDLDHPVINGKSDSSADKSDDAGTGYIKELMLEEGTVAHDWSPAPEEIMTKSDYAKIKAAIVALGGSLS